MKIYDEKELIEQNFNPIFINSLKQYWYTTKSFSCLGAPKRCNLFLYIYGFKMKYTDKCGAELTAESGDIVYTPIGSEYKVEIYDVESQDAYTVGVNFRLLDEQGEDIILSEGVKIFKPDNKALPMLFNGALNRDMSNKRTQSRILLMEIINSLAKATPLWEIDKRIAPALLYLAEHIEQNPTVGELSGICNMSEVYFRRLFKESLGCSPSEYRNALRLDRACVYLEYGEISVQEISDMLGYSSVSHFIKEFKKYKGASPLQYRKLSVR